MKITNKKKQLVRKARNRQLDRDRERLLKIKQAKKEFDKKTNMILSKVEPIKKVGDNQ